MEHKNIPRFVDSTRQVSLSTCTSRSTNQYFFLNDNYKICVLYQLKDKEGSREESFSTPTYDDIHHQVQLYVIARARKIYPFSLLKADEEINNNQIQRELGFSTPRLQLETHICILMKDGLSVTERLKLLRTHEIQENKHA